MTKCVSGCLWTGVAAVTQYRLRTSCLWQIAAAATAWKNVSIPFSLDGTTLYPCSFNVAAAAVAICRKSFVRNRSFRPGIDERLLSERYRCDHVFLSFTQLRTTKADILSERYRSRSSTPDFRSPCSISYRCNAILYTVSIFLTHSFPVANSIDVSTSSFFNISV